MKKRLLGILLVAVMAVSLAACGDKETQESSADSGQGTSPAQESSQEEGYRHRRRRGRHRD